MLGFRAQGCSCAGGSASDQLGWQQYVSYTRRQAKRGGGVLGVLLGVCPGLPECLLKYENLVT